ncbi:hypothetical protein [Pseudomonas caspiana]|uniref:hypothetical protein n=1 Tax=Pseudomonas caspiana TaxID=1451454 RepID=UPI0032EB761A
MSKVAGSKNSGGSSKSPASGSKGRSSHPGPGGNWPSTTGNDSGGKRGNAPPKNG